MVASHGFNSGPRLFDLVDCRRWCFTQHLSEEISRVGFVLEELFKKWNSVNPVENLGVAVIRGGDQLECDVDRACQSESIPWLVRANESVFQGASMDGNRSQNEFGWFPCMTSASQ
jgi:hypothetical protein